MAHHYKIREGRNELEAPEGLDTYRLERIKQQCCKLDPSGALDRRFVMSERMSERIICKQAPEAASPETAVESTDRAAGSPETAAGGPA